MQNNDKKSFIYKAFFSTFLYDIKFVKNDIILSQNKKGGIIQCKKHI